MKLSFLKSVTTGIACLTLMSGCSYFAKEEAHKCGGKNSCKGKKSDKHSCGAKKESSKCSSNSCSGKK